MSDKTQVEEITTVERSQPQRVVRKVTTVDPEVITEHPQKVFEKKKAIFRFYQIIWYILGIIEVLLGFRMALKAIGASPFSGFVSLIYSVSNPLAIPFQGIVRSTVNGTSILEWSTIVAALVYLVIAYGIFALFQFIKPVSKQEVEQGVDPA